MQSTYHVIFSIFAGVVLVLASCVLLAPLLAVLVAAACVSAAWFLLRLQAGLAAYRREDLRDFRDNPAAAIESVEP